ncbi:hypothetical protein Kalk_19715 [Ketobacter alkanivorans]|uniref:histidine kinase n=1 Tax=Ketobacter alkanivorans TaxID=1917421 RepID=A0A2K9LQB2_9GAMM|nr:hypothetical protein Kalk_19715 [Ketobacter alkanivorans]
MIRAHKEFGKCQLGTVFAILTGLLLFLVTPVHGDTDAPSHPVASIPLKVDGYDLAPYLLFWHDKNGRASFEEAFDHFNRGGFKLLPDGVPNLGFRKGSVWFYLGLNNPYVYKRMLLLEVDYAVLDQVEMYCSGPEQGPIYYPSGDHVQYDSRPLKVRNFVFPLPIEAFQSLDCLIRVRSNTNILLPLRAYDNLSYIEHTHVMERFLGTMYGVALAFLFYNIIQYVLTKKIVFAYFSAHVLGGMAYMSFMDGTLAPFWIALEMQDVGTVLAICIGVGSALLFSSEFLELKGSRTAYRRVGQALVYGTFGLFILTLFAPMRLMHILISAYTLAICSYLLVIGVQRWLEGYAPAKVYLLGFGMVFILVIWIVLNIFFLKSDVRWITYGVSTVWMVELVVLSVAISIRIKSMELERVDMSEKMRLIKDESHTKTEFLAKVSHEIRTPMSGMLGLMELLDTTPLNKDQRRYISAIQNAGKGLLEVINDMLDFSRMEAGKMELNSDLFQLQDLLSDACSIYEFDARQKGIELACMIAPGTPLNLIGDSVRIRQILLNTLSNALKYTKKGFVHINVHLTDQIHNDKLVLRFEVEDSGMGIAAEDQNKLFQSYSQLNSDKFSSRVSSGLGLVISQQFVQLMGGQMGVKSELGAGACFWFDIPLGMPDAVEIAEKSIVLELFDGVVLEPDLGLNQAPMNRQQPVGQISKASRVLLVEDNEINQSVLIEFLAKMGIQPEVADNGRAAVEFVQQEQQFDLILMDCEMPVMDGYEAASRIIRWQKSRNVQHTPIIALSAHALQKHRDMALEVGMVDYLTKPISYEQLHVKLARYLELEAS